MNCDIDHNHPEVRDEIFKWVDWFIKETKVDGFRYDALKHISGDFIYDLSKHIYDMMGKDKFYLFGEFWQYNTGAIESYLQNSDYNIDLFDVPLHFHMAEASKSMGEYDMRKIFDLSLIHI